MAAQCIPDRLLTSLRVTFAEDITTTYLIPVPNDDEKAALYYTRRDLQIFKLTYKLRTQRKIVILMKLIADRNAQDALNKRKEENIQAMQFQTTESFYNAGGSALRVEELAWKRTPCCTKTEDCHAASAPMILPDTRGSRLIGDLLDMANTNPQEENVQAMNFQKALEEITWKRTTCCTKTEDCDATSAPVMLPDSRGSQLNGDLLGMANTKVQAMEFQMALEEITWKRTCCTKTEDCDAASAPVMLPDTRGSRLNGDLLGMANTNPQEENVQAIEFQMALEEITWKRTCCTKTEDCHAASAPVMLPDTRGSRLNGDLLGMANTNPQEENVQAMEFQKALEEITWKRTCCTKVKDCHAASAPVIFPETWCSQINGDLLGTSNSNPQEDNVPATEFQKIKSFYIGGSRASQEERTCSDLKDYDTKAILPETRGSQLNDEVLALAG
jgi:hypothetical protein